MKLFGIEFPRPKAFVIPPEPTKAGRFTVSVQPSLIAAAEVDEWKAAVKAARSQFLQDRSRLYDFYQDTVDFDAHVRGLIDKRVLSTVGRKLEYVINDEPDEKVAELIESPRFEELRRRLLTSRVFWGMGLFEVFRAPKNGRNWLGFSEIPIKHIDPYEKLVRVTQYSPSKDDRRFDNVPTALFVGEPNNYGLLLQLSLLSIWKRETMNDWAGYSQLAGTNFREVLIRGEADPLTIRKAAESVWNAGAGVQAHNDQYEIKTQNATSSSQNETFRDRTAYLDDQMTKLVLGQTMTTEDGSSRSQAEVHERVQESIFDADAKSEVDFFNFYFYDIQALFDVPDGGTWRHKESNTLKMQLEIENDLKIKSLGFVFTQEYIAEKYDIEQKETDVDNNDSKQPLQVPTDVEGPDAGNSNEGM